MNCFRILFYFVIKTALETCLSFLLEVLKFILVLLLTYAFALGIFSLIDEISQERSTRFPLKKKKVQTTFDLQKGNSSEAYPYIINYNSKSEQQHLRFGNAGRSNQTNGFDSDDSIDEVVQVGSFKRPAAAGEEGEKSLIGRAIEDLNNANTVVNENGANISKNIS